MLPQLTEAEKENINAMLRPEAGVSTVVLAAVLTTYVETAFQEDEKRAAILVYASSVFRFASFSGPVRAASNYPTIANPNEFDRVYLDPAHQEAFDRIEDALRADERPDAKDRATLELVRFLKSLNGMVDRMVHILRMLQSKVFTPSVIPPADIYHQPSGTPIELDVRYQRALWKHRALILELRYCIEFSILTLPAMGGTFYQLVSNIEDEDDRACVIGFIFEQLFSAGRTAILRQISPQQRMSGAPIV